MSRDAMQKDGRSKIHLRVLTTTKDEQKQQTKQKTPTPFHVYITFV